MARGQFDGDDIYLWLTEQEIIELGSLKIVGSKLTHPSLEIMLKQGEGFLKTVIQEDRFDDLGDGIKVNRTDYGFLVKFNDNAYWRLRDNGICGTRYSGENKIHIVLEH